MPEALEAEMFRRTALAAIGRTIASVEVDPMQAQAFELEAVLPGHEVTAARRRGKLVLLDTGDGPTVGLHFGMTGRLVIDDVTAIERLEYSSHRDDPAWDRLVMRFADGGRLRVNDPRRLARFTVDPDETRLGPDVFEITIAELGDALRHRRTSIKAVLLDQSAIAGIGNLLADELLWQTGIDPRRPAAEISRPRIRRLHAAIGEHLPVLFERGGSHRGVISPEVRAALPPCPRCGAPLRRTTVAGRTTVWCPRHQRV